MKSTAVAEISHLLIHARMGREQYTPHALYTDITPANETFWHQLLGADTMVLLGLFHLMQRVLDTLEHRCELYWQCLVQLQHCFYKTHDADLQNLLRVLKEGLLDKNRKKMSDTEINKCSRQ